MKSAREREGEKMTLWREKERRIDRKRGKETQREKH